MASVPSRERPGEGARADSCWQVTIEAPRPPSGKKTTQRAGVATRGRGPAEAPGQLLHPGGEADQHVRIPAGLVHHELARVVIGRRAVEPAVAHQDPIGAAIDGVGRTLEHVEQDGVGGHQADTPDARQLLPEVVGQPSRVGDFLGPAAMLLDEPAPPGA